MLRSIYIKDLALIDEVRINFTQGFNVFTGETGAGKSIIIDAIGLLLGNKAEKTLIKEGKSCLRVEGLFEIEEMNNFFSEIFAEIGIEEENLISLTRVYNSNGKSEYMINGELCTLNLFKKISGNLLDIFGQHDNQKLLDKRNHINFLDKFIGETCDKFKNKIQSNISELKQIKKEISLLGGDDVQRVREIDFLSYEIKQIENAGFKEGEEEELLSQKRLMLNSERLYNSLSDISTKTKGVNDISVTLKEVVSILGGISGIDDVIDQCRDRVQSVRWELDDILCSLEDYSKRIDYNEKRLESIEERLDLINDFKRKYGRTISDILSYLQQAKERVNNLSSCKERMFELEKEKNVILKKIYDESLLLHDLRVKNARKFEKVILEELQDLGMKNSKFHVDINFPKFDSEIEKFISIDGLDEVEFLFSANLGQSVKSLDKIVSGGELSRFSLAFKTIINIDGIDKTLIFDEIDTGIGGNTGSVVGKKITKISRNSQVICITHLAQIASFADAHYKIIKLEKCGKTTTMVSYISGSEKVEEIGRMIGSIESKNYAELHSKELISESEDFKYKLSFAK